jgi:sugar (pentulose or hexulose) kinase
MPLLLGLDLGTTTITALAVDSATGRVFGCATAANRAALPCPPGRSEWDMNALAGTACDCLRQLAGQFGLRRDLAALGVTGQQHGVVLVDGELRPVGPFINWQDGRGEEPDPETGATWTQTARRLLGVEAPGRTGCRLATGYLAVTLYWLARHGQVPAGATACFAMDYLVALLTGTPPVTDPTCAASAGVLDLARGDWADDLLAALDLPRELLPPVKPSGSRAGGLTGAMALKTWLPQGLPVFVGLGDNQASFLGSVADRAAGVLVNVGTGGQVVMWSPHLAFARALETRPFPGGGCLFVAAGLSGGSAYALLERFFRAVGRDVLGQVSAGEVYEAMNRLAAAAPAGADGVNCEPFFSGTRSEPWVRANWTGLSPANFTPGHLARALLEGLARSLADSQGRIAKLCGRAPGVLIGSGNGLRANPLLARIVADAFGLPLRVPAHREEAAFGAALLAGVGAGVWPDLDTAGRIIRYAESGDVVV